MRVINSQLMLISCPTKIINYSSVAIVVVLKLRLAPSKT